MILGIPSDAVVQISQAFGSKAKPNQNIARSVIAMTQLPGALINAGQRTVPQMQKASIPEVLSVPSVAGPSAAVTVSLPRP